MLMIFHLETATEVHFIITIAAHFKDLIQSVSTYECMDIMSAYKSTITCIIQSLIWENHMGQGLQRRGGLKYVLKKL